MWEKRPSGGKKVPRGDLVCLVIFLALTFYTDFGSITYVAWCIRPDETVGNESITKSMFRWEREWKCSKTERRRVGGIYGRGCLVETSQNIVSSLKGSGRCSNSIDVEFLNLSNVLSDFFSRAMLLKSNFKELTLFRFVRDKVSATIFLSPLMYLISVVYWAI